jgi:hypothetical protein
MLSMASAPVSKIYASQYLPPISFSATARNAHIVFPAIEKTFFCYWDFKRVESFYYK